MNRIRVVISYIKLISYLIILMLINYSYKNINKNINKNTYQNINKKAGTINNLLPQPGFKLE